MNTDDLFQRLRREWLDELMIMAPVCDFTQSTGDEDEQEVDMASRDFLLLEEMASRYLTRTPKKVQKPDWMIKTVECLQSEGPSLSF